MFPTVSFPLNQRIGQGHLRIAEGRAFQAGGPAGIGSEEPPFEVRMRVVLEQDFPGLMRVARGKRFPGVGTVEKKVRSGFGRAPCGGPGKVTVQLVEREHRRAADTMADVLQQRGAPEAPHAVHGNSRLGTRIQFRAHGSGATFCEDVQPRHSVGIREKPVEQIAFRQRERHLIGVAASPEGANESVTHFGSGFSGGRRTWMVWRRCGPRFLSRRLSQ